MLNDLRVDSLICPHIIGNVLAKKAVMLQLFSEPRLHEQISLLLIGDAQSGKTQMAYESSRIAFRGTYSGLKITPVGMLEMLCDFDSSSCLVQDEFDKIDKTVRHMLLEAMELGQVTVTKHRIRELYPARVNVLACANPRSNKLNPHMSVLNQTNFSLPLLSRFALVIPFFSVDSDFYGDIARGVNSKHTVKELQDIKDYIIEQRAKHTNIKMPTTILSRVGKRVQYLKEEAVSRQMIGPRTIHSFIHCIKAACRMNGVDTATKEEFKYVDGVFTEALVPRMI